jgi:hypothetical protein
MTPKGMMKTKKKMSAPQKRQLMPRWFDWPGAGDAPEGLF